MEPMKDLVKNQEWQTIRKSLLGKWSSQPDWCCSQLKKYLGSIKSTHEKKLRIVMNYLTGTGFRTGRIKHNCISRIRAEISAELKIRKMKGK